MKLGELQNIIDLSITQKQRSQMVSGNIKDKEVLITVANGSSINTRPSVKIKSAGFGFDWESHQFRIEPQQNLFTEFLNNISVKPIITPQYYYCPKCKVRISQTYNFCNNCGQKFDWEK